MRAARLLALLVCIPLPALAQQRGLSVYISADMEGVAGLGGSVADLRVNGVSVGEGGMNTLFAAWYGVPVVFISGDRLAIVQQRALVPAVAAVAVKSGIWDRAIVTLSPDSATAAIRRGVERALRGAPLPASGDPGMRPWDSAQRTIRGRIGSSAFSIGICGSSGSFRRLAFLG